MPLAAGTRLGPYEITGLLGAGGMGEVYRAHDARLQRDVAVKILPPFAAGDPDRIARFEQEARAVAALNHPNIVAVYDVGLESGSSFIVSELLTGSTLRERIVPGGLPVRKVVEWALGIANGLAAAHERGMVHRDLKPENIFVPSGAPVKILDFGLAKLTQPAAVVSSASLMTLTSPETTPGVVLGTVGYMAPEQVRGLSADHRADIFSFGAILYELLTGERAFHGATAADTITAILNADPPELPPGRHAVPVSLNLIIRRCLEKEPADRFQSARDLAFALETLLTTSSDVSPRALVSPRRRWLPAMTAAALVIVAAGMIWLGTRTSSVRMPRLALSISIPAGVTLRGGPVISPDGRAIAFTAFDSQTVAHIWVRSLDTFHIRMLEGTEGADDPFWSADARSIGFFARGKLWRIEVSGGPARPLAPVSDPRGGTWSRLDTIVYAPEPDGPLYRVAANGGAPALVTTLDRAQREISHRWPRFLDDGRAVLFMNRVADNPITRMIVSAVPVAGGAVTRLVDAESTGFYENGTLLFVRADKVYSQPLDARTLTLSGEPAAVIDEVWNDGVNIAGSVGFDASGRAIAWRPAVAGTSRVVWSDRNGKATGPSGPAALSAVPSPDGKRALLVRSGERELKTSLWLLDVARGTTTRFTPPDTSATSPVWSPDGRRVVYSLIREGSFDLYIKDAIPGAQDHLLVHSDAMKAAQSWSPDGKVLLFAAISRDTGVDLWTLDLHSGAKPRLFVGGEADQCCAEFSPDGRWVAYVDTNSGRPEVFVTPFAGAGDPVQISTNGGGAPDWRADGRELYYVAPDNRLMGVEFRGGTGSDAVQAGSPVGLFALRTTQNPGSTAVVALDRPYSALPDGRFLLADAPSATPPTVIHLLFDWASH